MPIITGSYQYLEEWLGGLGTFKNAYHTLNSPVYSDSSLSCIDTNGNRQKFVPKQFNYAHQYEKCILIKVFGKTILLKNNINTKLKL